MSRKRARFSVCGPDGGKKAASDWGEASRPSCSRMEVRSVRVMVLLEEVSRTSKDSRSVRSRAGGMWV